MTALCKYDAACRALAEAVSADEIMTIRLEAKALEALARVAKNFELEIAARKLRVRAEVRLGEMLIEGEEKGVVAGRGRQPKGSDAEPLPITLKDIGIDKKLSARARKLGGIGQRDVEAMLARFEQESHERGHIALDVLAAQERGRFQQKRRDLEQELSDASALLEGGRQFPNIYADPATKFLSGFGNRSIENHYVTMTTEQLCALPVEIALLRRHVCLSGQRFRSSRIHSGSQRRGVSRIIPRIWFGTRPHPIIPIMAARVTFSSISTSCCFISSAAIQPAQPAVLSRFQSIASRNANTPASRIISGT
jgi:hypothetical protein